MGQVLLTRRQCDELLNSVLANSQQRESALRLDGGGCCRRQFTLGRQHRRQQRQQQQQQQQHHHHHHQHQQRHHQHRYRRHSSTTTTIGTFPDLTQLPTELSLAILGNLGPTDLCLAACVWQNLANDDCLWRRLCQDAWPFCSAYDNSGGEISYRQLYLSLDEATLTFNADCFDGYRCLLVRGLVSEAPSDVAKFLHGAGHRLCRTQLSRFLETRPDVLDCLMPLKSFAKEFLPNALRNFFKEIEAPNSRNEYLTLLIDRFSWRFADTNPNSGLSKDIVFILCFSLILLSVDLFSPHVKNKMSKREFIRNTRGAAQIEDDYLGHLYDNIYLVGHVAPNTNY